MKETDRKRKRKVKIKNRERERKRERKTNMLGTYYATKWNETSHPKSVHVYLVFHQQIPAIQSKNDYYT